VSDTPHVALRTWHSDSKGIKPSQHLIQHVGRRYFHPKTGHIYIITGISFDSERELWMINYRNEESDGEENTDFDFSHLPEDFFREGRFLAVKRGT
jgi:hypothetical protein